MSGTPRTQKEILESAAGVLEDAIKIGLSHASPILVDRLVTLAVSAQGANLPRVSLSLKTVADEVQSILKREARADESRLLLLMARVYALMDVRDRQPLGLRDPNPLDLIVVLEPALFGARKYDHISQSFTWDVYDQADQLMMLSLPFREWSQDAIRVLEALEPKEKFQ